MTVPSQRMTWNEYVKTVIKDQPVMIMIDRMPGMYIVKDYIKLGQQDFLICLVLEPDPQTGKTKIVGGAYLNTSLISSINMFEDTGAEAKEKQPSIVMPGTMTPEQAMQQAEKIKQIGGKI